MDRPKALVASLFALAVFFTVIAGFYAAGSFLEHPPSSTTTSSETQSTVVNSLTGLTVSTTQTTTTASSTVVQSTVESSSTGSSPSAASSTVTSVTSSSLSASPSKSTSTATVPGTVTRTGTTTLTAGGSFTVTTRTVTATTTVTGSRTTILSATSASSAPTTTSVVSAPASTTTMRESQSPAALSAAAIQHELESSSVLLAAVCWLLLGGALVWRGRVRTAYSQMGFGSDVFELFMKMKGGPTRIKVLNTLSTPKDRLQLAEELGVDWKTVDRHVQVLSRNGFIREQSSYGTVRLYEVTPLGKMLLDVYRELDDGQAADAKKGPDTPVN